MGRNLEIGLEAKARTAKGPDPNPGIVSIEGTRTENVAEAGIDAGVEAVTKRGVVARTNIAAVVAGIVSESRDLDLAKEKGGHHHGLLALGPAAAVDLQGNRQRNHHRNPI